MILFNLIEATEREFLTSRQNNVSILRTASYVDFLWINESQCKVNGILCIVPLCSTEDLFEIVLLRSFFVDMHTVFKLVLDK